MSKPPPSIIKPSTVGQNARLPLPAAAGGGANPSSTGDKTACKFGIRCTNMHCPVSDKEHGANFIRSTNCWRILNGQPCNICKTKEPKNDCQFGAKCRNRNTTCKKDHPPKEVDQFPSLGGKDVPLAVQAQSENDSANAAPTFAQMAAKPAVEPTSNKSYGVADITAAIEQLGLMAKQLDPNDQGPILNWIKLLTPLSGTPNLHELSTQVGQTIAAAESFCKAYTDLILKRDKEHQDQSPKQSSILS